MSRTGRHEAIRRYRADDLDRVLEVWRAASAVGHPVLDDDFLERERIAIARDHLPTAETWVWQGGLGGEVVGFIALLGDEVGAIFVDPARHGEGIGRALLDHARALRRRLVVEVFAANALGRRFYDGCGFVETGRGVHDPTGLEVIRMALGSAS